MQTYTLTHKYAYICYIYIYICCKDIYKHTHLLLFYSWKWVNLCWKQGHKQNTEGNWKTGKGMLR